jgi:hypothetical protein
MKTEEFNKILLKPNALKQKLDYQKTMLVECREMTFEHNSVKLQHCRIDNVTEDEFTMLQRSFENVLSLRVDALKKKLSLLFHIQRRRRQMAAITFTYCPEEMHYLRSTVSQLKKKREFSDDNENPEILSDSTAEN